MLEHESVVDNKVQLQRRGGGGQRSGKKRVAKTARGGGERTEKCGLVSLFRVPR